jgi:hypothetical protein
MIQWEGRGAYDGQSISYLPAKYWQTIGAQVHTSLPPSTGKQLGPRCTHRYHESKSPSTCYFNNKYICTYSCKLLKTFTTACGNYSAHIHCGQCPVFHLMWCLTCRKHEAWRLQLRASLTDAGTCTSSPLRSLVITIWHPNLDLQQTDTKCQHTCLDRRTQL